MGCGPLANCSTASVSRVLNDPERVTPDIRARVNEAMRELGYMPNSAARALRSLRSRIMGIVIPTLNHAIYARLVEALQRRLADEDIRCSSQRLSTIWLRKNIKPASWSNAASKVWC